MRHITNFRKVESFMKTFGQTVRDKPFMPDLRTQKLRYELIEEELEELRMAMATCDIVDVADALTDLLYVVYGAGHAYGLDLDICFNHIHDSNMSKLGPEGKPIYREDGKVLKGPGYWEPRLTEVVDGL